jgi:beta-phosphoglucomutase-like phosphatase (HAD superfamily)
MNAIIFDMDGILVDTMPYHYEAMKRAVKEFADIELDKRTFYLLEGMPIIEMAQKILELNGCDTKQTEKTEFDIVAKKIGTRKKQIFLEMKQIPESFKGVRELIHDDLEGCLKAVVTGSSKQELDTIIEHNFGTDAFDVAINGDEFEGKGKPDPSSYISALQRLEIPSSQALIVENAPLGVQAANNAKIKCIVILNTSPLLPVDFEGIIKNGNIFTDIKMASGMLKDWGCGRHEIR